MKKLFISQPMRGKSNEEIIAEREKAVKAAAEKLGEPVEVIDSFSRTLLSLLLLCGFSASPLKHLRERISSISAPAGILREGAK